MASSLSDFSSLVLLLFNWNLRLSERPNPLGLEGSHLSEDVGNFHHLCLEIPWWPLGLDGDRTLFGSNFSRLAISHSCSLLRSCWLLHRPAPSCALSDSHAGGFSLSPISAHDNNSLTVDLLPVWVQQRHHPHSVQRSVDGHLVWPELLAVHVSRSLCLPATHLEQGGHPDQLHLPGTPCTSCSLAGPLWLHLLLDRSSGKTRFLKQRLRRGKTFRDEVEVTEHLTDWEFWEIRSLYPMVGLTSLVVTPGYLACWLLERPNIKSEDRIKEREACKEVDIGCRRQVALKKITRIKHFRWLLVALMAVYYFAFIGVESSLRTFTSTFAVSSSLKLTRAQVGILLNRN